MKVHCIYDVEGWAYYNRFQAFKKYAPNDVEVTGSTGLPEHFCDIIFCSRYGQAPALYKNKPKKSHFIVHINCAYPTINIEYAHAAVKTCDSLVVSSYGMQEYLQQGIVIEDGVDLDLFYDEGKARNDIALWCSSEFHKLHKGYDLAKRIPCVEAFVTDSHAPDRTRIQMREWYNRAKVFLVLSRSEGTPNPLLESAACGCVPVSTIVGVAPRLIEHGYNGFLLSNLDRDYISMMIEYAINNYDEYKRNILEDIRKWSWEIQAAKYFALFRRAIA